MSGRNGLFDYYRRPGLMTFGGPHAEALATLQGVEAVAMAVQGVLLHEAWAQQYNQELTPARRAQAHLRPVRRMLDAILEIDAAPLGCTARAD